VTKTVEVPASTVKAEPLTDFLPVLVLSVSSSVSNNNVVERPIVSIVSVTIACSVATIRVPGPDTVAVNPNGRVVVKVVVTITTSQTSRYRLHSRFPSSKTVHIFTSTSDGVSPAVSDCQGTSQYVNVFLTVGAGVIDGLFVAGVGVSKLKPHSVENVTSWLQSVIVIFDAKPVNVVAQTVVITGAYTVSQLPVPEGMGE
jgi:hypothetical protein